MTLSLGYLPFYLLPAPELKVGPKQTPTLDKSPSGMRVECEWESRDLHPTALPLEGGGRDQIFNSLLPGLGAAPVQDVCVY